jgi:hypothetical protein
MVEFSKFYTYWKIVLEMMTGKVVSEVDTVMCVALSKAEKHVRYWELVSTTEL